MPPSWDKEQADTEYLQGCFRHFARMCEGYSPLYAALSPRIAEDPAVLSLAAARPRRQLPVNLLFGAVHDLLLAGAEHPLAAFYPSVGGDREPDDAYPVFADFCRRFEKAIVEIVSARRVQTNEVGRCGLLLPAFSLAFERLGLRPLHLIEVGSSAGLNLRFDRYHYEYTSGPSGAVRCLGPESPVRVRTELRDGVDCPLPDRLPPVAGRVGIDIAPVDVTDDDAVRWIEALIWPDQVHRIALCRAAVALARTAPPRLIEGDGLEVVPRIVESVPAGGVPCVFHSHATCQMNDEWRQRFAARLADLGRGRDLAHISLEWLGDDPGPRLCLTLCTGGEARTTHLADCHHHGSWMRWLAG